MLRIGIDLGGTKIAGIGCDIHGSFTVERRLPTPQGDYAATLDAIGAMVETVRRDAFQVGLSAAQTAPFVIGLGIPGSISPVTGRVQNANSVWLNGQPLQDDLACAVSDRLKIQNDANCFVLSEGFDGAAQSARSAFGIIVGTGCGGGVLLDGKLINGPRGISGEWGHIPLPQPSADELPGPACWCGRHGCLETWISGPALAADFERWSEQAASPEAIVARAANGDSDAEAALRRHADRMARGLGAVINILDPEIIVIGGGLSNLANLYRDLPDLIAPHIFADNRSVDIRPPVWGDSSGVRGAARLWSTEEL